MAIASGAESTQMMPRVSFPDPIAVPVPLPVRVRRLPIALTGTVLVVVGTLTQLVALLTAPWWQATVAGRQVSLGFADFAPRAWRGFGYIYFDWGAWLIVGLTLGLGLAACVRWRGAHAFRVVAAPLAVAASIAPIAALLVFAHQSGWEPFHVVRNYALGPYLAVLGTMATAFGAAAGSAR